MSLGRVLAWTVIAAVIGGGFYALVAGGGDTPEAVAPVVAPKTQIVAPAPMPAAPVDAEALAPAEALARDSAAAEADIKKRQEEEIRAIPAAPPDMGMIDKDGIRRDAEEAAKQKTP